MVGHMWAKYEVGRPVPRLPSALFLFFFLPLAQSLEKYSINKTKIIRK